MTLAHVRVASRPGGRHHQPLTQDAAIALLNKRRSRLITLGTVNLWRAITSQQLAEITGQPGLNSSRSEETALLFDAGQVQRGQFHYAGRSIAKFPEIFRPDPAASEVNLREHLRFSDWMGTSFGGPLMSGHQYNRHNLLATELSLRAAEICPIRSVLGESLAQWPRLFDSKLRPNPHRSADALWVRNDGLKIAIEITATFTSATVKKIEQLAELLARDSSKSVVVLFVVAQPKDDHTGDVAKRLRRAIRKSSHSSGARILAEVEKRLVIAKWTDFFPGPGLVSREFVPLRAKRYTAAQDDWTLVDLLDPYDVPFEGAGSPEVEETSRNLDAVFGVPWWARTGPGPDFDALLIERAGFDKVLEIKAATDARRRTLAGR